MKLQDLSPSAEAREGKWFTFEHPAVPQNGGPPLELRIRTADLEAYRFALNNGIRSLTEHASRGKRGIRMPKAEAQYEAETHALARHVLVGARGLEDTMPDGAPFDGDDVKHREILLSSPYVREFVLDKAEDAEAFLEDRRGN